LKILTSFRAQALIAVLACVILSQLGLIDPATAGMVAFFGMAAPADYWDTVDLKAAVGGGLVNEDVMQKIWDISRIPLPFTDLVGEGAEVSNSYTEWTKDGLQAVDLTNALVSGADATGNQANGGSRNGNHCQISDKVLAVTERANATDNIGRDNELAYQLMMRQRELKQDIEAICLYPQASVADNNDATAGKVGTFPAWLITNDQNGAGGAATGFNTTTKLVAIPTTGAGRALTMVMVDDAVEAAYLAKGDITVAMSVPQLIKRLAKFLLTSNANVATPTANVRGEGGKVEQTSQGYVNVMVTDFGTTLELVPNRLQQVYDSGDSTPVDVCDLVFIDPTKVEVGYLIAIHSEKLAKLGLSEREQLSADWTLAVYMEEAHAIVRHLLPTGTVTAT
jgi:hypothetical protein